MIADGCFNLAGVHYNTLVKDELFTFCTLSYNK